MPLMRPDPTLPFTGHGNARHHNASHIYIALLNNALA